jgi:hypothetical protein
LNSGAGCYRFNGWQVSRRRRDRVDSQGSPVALIRNEYNLPLAFSKRQSCGALGGKAGTGNLGYPFDGLTSFAIEHLSMDL